MNEPRVGRRATLRGRVQGVGFRWQACERARALGLAGWVKNLADGRVETRFEGSPEAVEAFVEWLRAGPPPSHVDGIDVREEAPSGAEGFEIAAGRGE